MKRFLLFAVVLSSSTAAVAQQQPSIFQTQAIQQLISRHQDEFQLLVANNELTAEVSRLKAELAKAEAAKNEPQDGKH